MKESRHLDFRTVAILYMVLGGIVGFFVHFWVISTPWANGLWGLAR